MPDYNNKGILFENAYKQEEKHPDYTGKCKIDGVDMRVAGWWKFRTGKPRFLSLSFTPEEEYQKNISSDNTNTPQPDPPEPENLDEIDDDLPF